MIEIEWQEDYLLFTRLTPSSEPSSTKTCRDYRLQIRGCQFHFIVSQLSSTSITERVISEPCVSPPQTDRERASAESEV